MPPSAPPASSPRGTTTRHGLQPPSRRGELRHVRRLGPVHQGYGQLLEPVPHPVQWPTAAYTGVGGRCRPTASTRRCTPAPVARSSARTRCERATVIELRSSVHAAVGRRDGSIVEPGSAGDSLRRPTLFTPFPRGRPRCDGEPSSWGSRWRRRRRGRCGGVRLPGVRGTPVPRRPGSGQAGSARRAAQHGTAAVARARVAASGRRGGSTT